MLLRMSQPTPHRSHAGWPHQESPFHEGEQLAQLRAGVAGKLEGPGRRMIRAYMPDEHRELFEKLPYFFVGAVDDEGWPWATMLTGSAGFVRTPDEHTLAIVARPLDDDPVAPLLTEGRAAGALGIELATRRRNRANGVITAANEQGFSLSVRQSFGNCPQYIQVRRPLDEPPTATAPDRATADATAEAITDAITDATLDAGAHAAPDRTSASASPSASPRRYERLLDEAAIALIERADTCFLASATAGAPSEPSHGVDVSHRGGRPGFLVTARPAEAEAGVDATWILLPDYRGNFMFNTLGNLAVNPRAGLLVPDFESGALLSLTAEAQILWDHPLVESFPGAQRLVVLRVVRGVLLPGALPWRWSEPQLAPQL